MQPPTAAARLEDRAPPEAPGSARPLRVCFVALKAHAALTDADPRGQLGGAEVQQVRLACGLRDAGLDPVFVVHDVPVSSDRPSRVPMVRAYRPEAGLRGLRFVHPRWTGLWRAMREADADVYYFRGGGVETGQVALFARWFGRRFVLGIPNDSFCHAALETLPSARQRLLYRLGLRWADRIVAQTRRQQRLLAESFGVDSVVIPSLPPPEAFETPLRTPHAPPRLVWIGRVAPEKRPHLLLEMAERRPDWQFVLVGAPNRQTAYGAECLRRAERLANVTLLGTVRHTQMPQVYRDADLLVSTSRWEGFPNVLLEAWRSGLPTLSTIDFDDVIRQYGLGGVAADVEGLLAAAERLLSDPQQYRRCAQRCRDYIRRQHDEQRILQRYVELLSSLAPRAVRVSSR